MDIEIGRNSSMNAGCCFLHQCFAIPEISTQDDDLFSVRDDAVNNP
jgi:hypothetical protein